MIAKSPICINNNVSNIKAISRKLIPYTIWDFLHRIKCKAYAQKEINVTRKYSEELGKNHKNEKIVMLFIIYMPEAFPSLKSICDEALKDDKYNVFILAQPHISNQQGLQMQNPAYDYLKKIYKNVINAYENNKWFDIKTLNPNYVFYTRPYISHYYKAYQPSVVRQFSKVCYHAYSFDMDNTADFYEVYNYPFISNVTFVFNSAESSKKKVQRMVKSKGLYPQVLNLGFTRFDLLQNEINQNNNYSEKQTVLWIPRWTAQKKQGKKQGHFFQYVNSFFEFAQEHTNVDFIIRPHPLMFANFINLGLCTQNDIDNLYVKCKQLGNISIDTEKDYFPSLRKATIMLADYSALIVEFFVMGKPIIYCDNGKTFNYETKRIDSVLYHAKKWIDIENNLIKLLDNKDEMKNQRLNEVKVLMKEENVGKKIIDFIKEDYFRE